MLLMHEFHSKNYIIPDKFKMQYADKNDERVEEVIEDQVLNQENGD